MIDREQDVSSSGSVRVTNRKERRAERKRRWVGGNEGEKLIGISLCCFDSQISFQSV